VGKAILLVLDGFGIGAMEDCVACRPEDVGADTYGHLRKRGGLDIPVLERLGLAWLTGGKGKPEGAVGRTALAHAGADTYMGHQELVGSRLSTPVPRLMAEVYPHVEAGLRRKGYRFRRPWPERPLLLVEEAVIIADNIETDPGNILNVTADLSRISFPQAVAIAKAVRSEVDVSRVIALGNALVSIQDLLAAVKERNPGQWGVDSPEAGVYGSGYQVRHQGWGIDLSRQFPALAEKEGLPVYRIGKTADVIEGTGWAAPLVETEQVLAELERNYHRAPREAAFLINVQETDLAGHQQDANWYASILNQVDRWLKGFLPAMTAGDLLLVTADHGNDPTIGHPRHTREYTPVLAAGAGVRPTFLGTRTTLADLGATLADYFRLDRPEAGSSFLKKLYG